MERLNDIGIIPVNRDILFSLYSDLKHPADKVTELEQKGLVIRVIRDLYVVSPKVHNLEISTELVANHLYRPSYISLETALSYYGMIPERVYTIRSMTTKRAKTFSTPLGNFEFKTIPTDYFSIGIRQEIINNQYAFLTASPTKAICDMIVATPNLRLQSVKAMQNYLTEDLRIDFDVLKTLDKDIVRVCVEVGKKKNELGLLLRMLSEL
ncbi:MAG: hypothetical protein LBI15_08465 [Dysgonamonadaceae bacterium]|jgi:predicted transcriptional regulator of viral defense system|nr:hypothetical protein [Dysgonamonadaceae bacterium]